MHRIAPEQCPHEHVDAGHGQPGEEDPGPGLPTHSPPKFKVIASLISEFFLFLKDKDTNVRFKPCLCKGMKYLCRLTPF